MMDGDRDNMMVDLYDESRDTFFTISIAELLQHAALDETDKLKFADMGNQAVVVENQSTLQAQFRLAAGDAVTCLVSTSANNPAIAAALPNPPTLPAWIAWAGNAPGQRAGPNQPVLLLITSNANNLSDFTDNNRKREQRSFYTGSGWFNRPSGGAGGPVLYMPFITTMSRNRIGSNAAGDAAPVNYNPRRIVANANQPPTLADRHLIFKKLMMGVPNNGAQLDKVIEMGMRPNLHIGRMVFADKKPTDMRFVHVAGHIMAQTVVTRGLATRLMQQVYQDPARYPAGQGIGAKIRNMFGITANSMTAIGGAAPASYYGIETSVLAYMAAAVLHPENEVRETCKNALETERGFNMEAIGDELLTWVKYFLSALPTHGQGASSPTFDAFDQVSPSKSIPGRLKTQSHTNSGIHTQGTNLARILIEANPKQDPERNENSQNINQAKQLRLPVMYLGQLQDAGVINDLAPNVADDNALVGIAAPPEWMTANNTVDSEREVKSEDFKNRLCTVFPGFAAINNAPRQGNGTAGRSRQGDINWRENKIRKQDVIAINQTANTHDALRAFVQIMCKRFFTCSQELFVETSQPKDEKLANTQQAPDAAQYGGLTRLALTSNDYARLFEGRTDELTTSKKWEIVIVRPNIEHNMLAAVLGRGGSEDLGSTFWGQTELSCYDDSMHGIW